ncbi:hypothetical protein EON65_19925 [archaeon]|nr:MAG: hypothetical protein EON65_19925 [archaeon]
MRSCVIGFVHLESHHIFLCQIGVVKRMLKEVASYEKEVITNEARVQKMRDDGRDIYGKPIFCHLLTPYTIYTMLCGCVDRHSQAGGSLTRELYDGAR